MTRIVFVMVSGRSGSVQTAELLTRVVPNCWAANDFPEYKPTMPGRWGQYQMIFHRKFIETHELLGRGKTIVAHDNYDDDYVMKVYRKRQKMLQKEFIKRDIDVYVDVSLFFGRSFYIAARKLSPKFSILQLLRNPLQNMQSKLNRHKPYFDRNNDPSSSRNVLTLDPDDMSKEELYLWIWTELYLRTQDICEYPNVEHVSTIRTEDMETAECWAKTLDELALPHGDLEFRAPPNGNIKVGFGATIITPEHARLFERFLDRIPPDIRNRVKYFDDYDPWLSVNGEDGESEAQVLSHEKR